MDIEITEIAYHRNGVTGQGFHAILFRWQPEAAGGMENFLATLFDAPGACAVIGLDRIEQQGVTFAGGNSWRGDDFEHKLRRAVAEKEAADLAKLA